MNNEYRYINESKKFLSSFNQLNKFNSYISSSFLKTQANIARLNPFLKKYTEYLDNLSDLIKINADFSDRLLREYPKQEFKINQTKINGKNVKIKNEVISETDFMQLVNFKKDSDIELPKLLIIAPMSGHFATLLQGTIEPLLKTHDVYITDWKNIRDVPESKGKFGLDEYIDNVISAIEDTGEDIHTLGFSQSTIPLLVANSILAADKSDYQPISMTLIGGPIDSSKSEAQYTKFAQEKDINWFKDNLIRRVPEDFKGHNRKVYPGYIQLSAFMSLNPLKHLSKLKDLFNAMVNKDKEQIKNHDKFYNEYLSVSDLSADFFLDTIKKIFQKNQLAGGNFKYRGKLVKPSKIMKTALFTIEGGKDDIVSIGETRAAHDLCSNLPKSMKFDHLEPNADHYEISMGKYYEANIVKKINAFTHLANKENKISYKRNLKKKNLSNKKR